VFREVIDTKNVHPSIRNRVIVLDGAAADAYRPDHHVVRAREAFRDENGVSRER
jgi:hypothetical protein